MAPLRFLQAASWLLLLFASALRAQEPAPGNPAPAVEAESQRLAALQKLVDGLKPQQGHVVLQDGLASLNVPVSFQYLRPQDAETVLTKIWGNQPGGSNLGMLLPSGSSPLDEDSWAVIISYTEDGYVKDDEASKIDYTELLSQMQAATREANKERTEAGYPAIDLVGWAQPPRYEQSTHKLYWAKELKFSGSDENTLNYNIRMLGRRGVLVLNAVAGMKQLPAIEKEIPAVLQMVDFQDGHRYTDFNPATDKVAAYGVAALVTGGILAKAGFFKLIIPTILAFKKVIIVGAIALLGVAKKLFGRKSEV